MNTLINSLQNDDLYFIIAALMALTVMYWLAKGALHRQRFEKRVKALQERRAHLKAEITAPRKKTKKSRSPAHIEWIRNVVRTVNPLKESKEQIQHLLINAGFRSKDAIVIFSFAQVISPVISLSLGLYLLNIDWEHPLVPLWKIIGFPGFLLFGLRLPQMIVTKARNKRYKKLQRALADTLDLLIICTEAGLSLAAGLDRVARELGNTYPEMAEELEITSVELGFLPERKKALLNLAERVDMAEVRGIANVLIQTEKYGTPLSQSLRTLSTEFRTQRMLRAEHKAAQLPAIMTIPMILFILPTLFIVIITPAIIGALDKVAGRF